jgi:hypothetical protein
MRNDYHSAHYPEQPAPAVYRYESRYGIAFAHDVTRAPLPGEYDACGVFYCDPPWRSGYAAFAARANAVAVDYRRFMGALVAAIPLHKPAVFVTGKHADKLIPADFSRTPVRLNEHAAIAYSRGFLPPKAAKTADDIGRVLAEEYRCGGDPCCGYGNTAKWFAQVGKRYVVSDINPRCIGYIAQQERGWLDVLPE